MLITMHNDYIEGEICSHIAKRARYPSKEQETTYIFYQKPMGLAIW
jgi:hypothetical protein